MMTDERHPIHMIPWIGGISRFGHSSTRKRDGLQKADNIEYDYDGTKHRRGGQIHLHRTPFREGEVVEDHFLRDSLRDQWTLTNSGHTYSFTTRSILRVEGDGVSQYTSSLESSLVDDTGTEKMKTLVTTLDTDPVVAAGQRTEISIGFRAKMSDLGLATTPGYWEFKVDPGQPGGAGAEWLFRIRFLSAAIQIWSGGAFVELSLQSTTNPFGVTSDQWLEGSNYYNWRFVVKKPGDYRADVYLHEQLIYGDVVIPTSSTATSSCYMEWKDGVTGGTNSPIDFSLDSVDVQGVIEPIRGCIELRSPSASSTVGRVGLYAGRRVYVDEGDYFNISCVDEELVSDREVDFKIYNGHLIYITRGTKPRRWRLQDSKGAEISSAPTGRYLQVHANRFWIAGDNDNRSRIYFSGLLNEDIWTTEDTGDFANSGFIDVQPDDGEAITGIGASYRGILPVYKQDSIHLIRGSGPDTFFLETVSKTIGCASHWGIANVRNDQFFPSSYGVHSLLTTQKFGDVEAAFLSRDIRKDWLEFINTGRLERAWAVNNEPYDRYELLVPSFKAETDGITPNLLLSLQYSIETDDFPFGIWSMKKIDGWSMTMAQRNGDIRPSHLVGGADGFLNKQDQGHRFDFPVFDALPEER